MHAKKYSNVPPVIQNAGAEVGAWLLAAGSFLVIVFLARMLFVWVGAAM